MHFSNRATVASVLKLKTVFNWAILRQRRGTQAVTQTR